MSCRETAELTDEAALNMARQALYRWASLALADPRGGTWQTLADPQVQSIAQLAANAVRDEPAAVPGRLARGERPVADLDPAAMFGSLPASPEAFNAAYERQFGLLVSGSCPAHGSDYVNSKFTFQRSQLLADIAGFYRAFGLQRSDKQPERPDHVSLELEFMAFLLGLERRAAGDDGDREERLLVCRAAQRRFFEEHVAWWIPTFARLLTLDDGAGFYGAVGRYLSALIPAERALLGIDVPMAEADPSHPEPPDACDGCALLDASL